MKTQIWPKTLVGKVAAIFSLLFIVLIALKIVVHIPPPTFSIAAFGIIGFLAGIVAVFKFKDRTVLTILSIIVGAVIIFWAVAEFLFPH